MSVPVQDSQLATVRSGSGEEQGTKHLAPTFLYSSKCVEGEFSEVRIQGGIAKGCYDRELEIRRCRPLWPGST
jgi:hypothetical protein